MSKELMMLQDAQAKTLNDVLAGLVASGSVVVAELNPSLVTLLSDAKAGGFAGRCFVGELKSYRNDVQIPDLDDEDATHEATVLELKDVSESYLGATFNMYGHNSGMRGKLSQVKDSKFVLVMFKGEVENSTKGLNAWKDFLILGFDSKATALMAFEKCQEAVGRPSVSKAPVKA